MDINSRLKINSFVFFLLFICISLLSSCNNSANTSNAATLSPTVNSIIANIPNQINEGDIAIVPIRPASKVDGKIVVSITSSDTTVLTVSPATMTFTATDYNLPKDIFITSLVNYNKIGGSATINISSKGMQGVNVTINTLDKYNSSNIQFPSFSNIPNALGIAVDDIGWKDYGPPDNTRSATMADYQTVINVGKNVGTRIMTAWILMELDPNTICANPNYNLPNTTSFLTPSGLSWNNINGNDPGINHSQADNDVMALVQNNAQFIELGLHGISHEHITGVSPLTLVDGEFALVYNFDDPNFGTSKSWGLADARAHLNAFQDILRFYFDASTSSFPKSFVPPAHGYYYGDAGDGNSTETTGVVLNEFGVKYVNGDLNVTSKVTASHYFDKGIIFIDRAYGANFNSEGKTAWDDLPDFPAPTYPDQRYGWVESHFPNFWGAEAAWTTYLKGINNDNFRYLGRNTAQISSQHIYRNYALISGINGNYTIDALALPDSAYTYNLLGTLVLKTQLSSGLHIQTASINNNAQIVGYYEDEYGFGYLVIGHKTNTMGRLDKTTYQLNATLGSDFMPSYIDQTDVTYNVYSFTTTANTASLSVEMYGTQDIKIKLPFTPSIVSSSSANLSIQSWSWTSPFLVMSVKGKDIQGETGVISISQ